MASGASAGVEDGNFLSNFYHSLENNHFIFFVSANTFLAIGT